MEKVKAYIRNIPKTAIISCVLCAVAIVAVLIVTYCTLGKELSELIEKPSVFKAWLDQYSGYSQVVFVAIRAFQTVLKVIPAEPLEIGSGYAFGTFGGLLWCSVGSLLGSLVILALTRLFGVRFVYKLIPQKELDELPIFADKKKWMLLVFIFYLLPGTPKDIMTYAAGLTKINLFQFLLITTVARIPSIITSTFCGSALGEDNKLLALAVFLATAVVSGLCVLVYKKFTAKEKVLTK